MCVLACVCALGACAHVCGGGVVWVWVGVRVGQCLSLFLDPLRCSCMLPAAAWRPCCSFVNEALLYVAF